MNKLLLLLSIAIFLTSCNETKEKEHEEKVVSSQNVDSTHVAAVADTSWINIWKTESGAIKEKLDELGHQLKKSSKKVATKANEDLVKELETQREGFDTSHTRAYMHQQWDEFKVKANRAIDSLNAKLSIE